MTTKKKHLIELMIEVSVKWPEGAEYAAQDKRDSRVNFYKDGKPEFYIGLSEWLANECEFLGDEYGVLLTSLCRNWHQTIVTKAQYEKALADQPEQPATIEPQPCGSATPATIEQRIAEVRAMERNLAEFRARLTDDLHALGITWLDGAICDAKAVQPVINDWRDLRVGDLVECISQGDYPTPSFEWCVGKVGTVIETEEPGKAGQSVRLKFENGGTAWIGHWRFIRRPQH